MATQAKSVDIAHGRYLRFDLLQRLEHLILLISFTLLGITGLAQKFAGNGIADATLGLLGGIETARNIHHVSAITMGLLAAYHIVAVGYRVFVLRARMSMLPAPSDFAELWNEIRYYLRLTKTPSKFGRYNYGEKMEYWAVVWGTIVMGITGFMMWNPIATAKLIPGEWIPAAKVAHGAEAILAVLAIIIWHFYSVHIKTFNKSIFTGYLDEHQMAHEHGRELESVIHGTAGRKIDPPVLRRRQMIYFPVAGVLLAIMAGVLVRFFTFENTAPITTVPSAVNVPVLVTATPLPTPTRAPTPTAAPVAQPPASGSEASFAAVQAVLKAKCGTCHGDTPMGGLNVNTYASLMKGGASGPVIVAKDPADSLLVKKVEGGNHSGQFSVEELALVKAWIAAGAAEKGAPSSAPTPQAAAGGTLRVTFVKDIQPIFQAKCASCHGTLGGLTLTTFESVMHGGTSGPAITPKDPEKSSIINKQAAGGHPGQLTPEEIELVRKWILDGALEQ
jgi:cytochrome b subunit of formate dehydrogenase/mono/diheme cytochrome c family protein